MDPADDLIARVMQYVKPFNGTDPNTSDEWYCKQCCKHAGEKRDDNDDYEEKKEEGETCNDDVIRLFTCSRCKLARYCSRDCQRADYQEHKEQCKGIADLTKEVRKLRAELEDIDVSMNGAKENLFETHVGIFWGIIETRDYCRARNHLSNIIEHMAHWYEIKMLLEESLKHKLSLLRLNVSDNMGLRSDVPFTLLKLNRDRHCMAFIVHWLKRDGNENHQELERRHSASNDGDWLYGDVEGEDILYQDVHDITGRREFSFDLNFMMAVLIIKLRLIKKYEEDVKQSERFKQTTASQLLGNDPSTVIGDALHGGTAQARKIDRQKRLVETYMDEIDENNPTMLPAVINPGPLKRQPEPEFFSHGLPSEAYFTLMRCNRLFIRIPGAEDILEQRFGPNPSYNYEVGGSIHF